MSSKFTKFIIWAIAILVIIGLVFPVIAYLFDSGV